jgi:sulfinoalanine decarboxylase/sulfinoalanine decarboxylase/aspartate 1-decarboxylase
MRNTLEVFQRLTTELLSEEEQNPVSRFIPSSKLFEELDLSLKKSPLTQDDFEQVLKELVFATTKTATNGFFNQLFGGRNEVAVLGDLLAVILNNSMYTYKAAGPQIGVEKSVLRKVCDIIGWNHNADGTFASGGSMTNFMSMLMARDKAMPQSRTSGVQNQMLVYTSKESHYSIPKNAAFCGIGTENVRYIPVTNKGIIDVAALEKMIEQDLQNGGKPIMVNLTSGTTVLGAFDPIRPVSAICKKHNMWLHVDGAYCGSVLFSNKYKHLIDGVELADSFSFNAHKMIGTPLTCSIIVTKDKKHLYDSFSSDASYLYQTDHDEFNLGKTSLQCGRRNDALKFWALWKSVGTEGLEKIIDKQFELADTARDYIRNNSNYTLYSFDESISLCFNYKDIPARDICTALYEHSKLLVGYGVFNDVEFIRLVTVNAQNENEDIIQFFKQMEQFIEENKTLFAESSVAS